MKRKSLPRAPWRTVRGPCPRIRGEGRGGSVPRATGYGTGGSVENRRASRRGSHEDRGVRPRRAPRLRGVVPQRRDGSRPSPAPARGTPIGAPAITSGPFGTWPGRPPGGSGGTSHDRSPAPRSRHTRKLRACHLAGMMWVRNRGSATRLVRYAWTFSLCGMSSAHSSKRGKRLALTSTPPTRVRRAR